MKEKDCKIVQDLLPNYIEKLTNEETNKFIEEHLKECDDCKKVYENMKKELQLSENKKDNREVKYIKKYNKKLKILKAIVLSIIAIYILIIARRMIIMRSISKKAEKYMNQTNFHSTVYFYNKGDLLVRESYTKDGNYLTTMTTMAYNKNKAKHILYKNGDDELYVIEQGNKKLINTDKGRTGGAPGLAVWVTDFETRLVWALTMSIRSGYCNGKECYIITQMPPANREIYVDKETGLQVREIQKSNKDYSNMDSVTDYEYTFNVVKDSDIVKPEIRGDEEHFD